MKIDIVKTGNKWVGVVYDAEGNIEKVTKQCHDRRQVMKEARK